MIQLSLVKLLGGAYLLWLPYQHFFLQGDAATRRTAPPARPWLGLTAFWATVVKVELTDIVFAIDSILVGVAMSPKLWVVLTGGILGIVAMRLVIGQLLTVVRRYPPLVDGAFVIIAWVGIKLLVEWAAQPRVDRLRDSPLVLARPHRRDLRRRVPVCAASRGPDGCGGRRRALSLQTTDGA